MVFDFQLYYYHDLDIVTLYRNNQLCISKAARVALDAFARGDFSVMIETSEPGGKIKPVRRVYKCHVILADQSEAAKLLKNVQLGFRSNFIKTAIRMFLCARIPQEYMQEGAYAALADSWRKNMEENKHVFCGTYKAQAKDIEKKPKTSGTRKATQAKKKQGVKSREDAAPVKPASRKRTKKAEPQSEDNEKYILQEDGSGNASDEEITKMILSI